MGRYGSRVPQGIITLLVLLMGGVGAELQAQLEATLTVDVRQEDAMYFYDYTLSNSLLSSLSINGLFIDIGNDRDVVAGELADANADGVIDATDNRIGVRSLESPAGWLGEYQPFEVIYNADFSAISDVKLDANGLPIFNNTEEVVFISGDGQTCSNESADIFPGSELVFTLQSEYAPGEQGYSVLKLLDTADGPCFDLPGFAQGTILAPTAPPAPSDLDCDFDGDGDCDLVDIDDLGLAIVAGENQVKFDLTDDMLVTAADLDAFLANDEVQRVNGDGDFNGTVAFADFLTLAASFGSEAGVTWSKGDFAVNGKVEFPDFLVLANNFGRSFGDVAAASVPEPSGLALILIASLACGLIRRKR